MNKNTPSKYRIIGRSLLAFAFLLLGGGLAVVSVALPQKKVQTATTTQANSIQLLIERNAVGKPHVTALMHAISKSIPVFNGSSARPMGVMRGANSQTAFSKNQSPNTALTPVFSEAISPTVSPRVSDLPAVSPYTISSGQPEEEHELANRTPQTRDPLEHDSVVQSSAAPTVGMPPVGASFEGIENNTGCNGCIPPDPNGAVGPNHYVQMVNSSFAIYSKTGALLSPPKAINSLWMSVPNSTCATHNNGDPIVIYDQLADRWLLSQFTVQSGTENYAECIAISQTPDPTGAYWLYQFDESADTFNDYPHIGIWPDGYYMTTNLFPNSALLFSTGAGAWAFERPKMLQGQPARYVYFDETDLATGCQQGAACTYTPNGQLPTSLEGKNPPPVGTPNYFVEVDNTNTANTPPATGLHDEMHIWKFHVDWNNPANSTFGTASAAPAPKAGFSGLYAANAGQPDFILQIADYTPVPCQFASGPTCIPEKVTPGQPQEFLEAVGDRLMYRVTYRNYGDHESLLVSHTAEVDENNPTGTLRTGVRWYELRSVSSTPVVYQQSTFAPLDVGTTGPLWRWMGSVAMDHVGDIAAGYSTSGVNDFVSLHYAGRLAGDPLNELTQGDALMFQGNGIEVAVPNYLQRNRWGDYSNLTVDPSDDCTFWYTNEYLPTNQVTDPISAVEWHTRIGSFKFPTCTVATPALVSVSSRKTHGTAGDFDIPLPFTGTRGVECRSGGANGNFAIVFTFANPVVNCGSSPNGTVQPGANANECVVNMTGVANAQYQSVSLTGVLDNHGNSGDVGPITFGVLLGDVNGSGRVDAADVSSARQQTLQTLTTSNFRNDFNESGRIDAADVSVARQQTLTSLPSTP
jgi:hypothetical protein